MEHLKGRLMNRSVIKQLIGREINIVPYNEERLRNPWYALHPMWAWIDSEGKYMEPSYDKIQIIRDSPFILDSHSYVEIEIEERITLGEGIVGLFIPASHSVEDGLIVNVGKLDSNYQEMIKFGLFNAKRHEVGIYQTLPIAYLAFFDLRDASLTSAAKESTYDHNIRGIRGAETIDEFVSKFRNFLMEQTK